MSEEKRYFTIDNNKIATFMGLEPDYMDSYLIVYKRGGYNNEIWRQNELKYHRSWDWLMPVIEKIKSLRPKLPNFNVVDWFEVHMYGQTCIIKSGLRNSEKEIISPYFYEGITHGKTDILTVYDAVLTFINWYKEKENE